VEGGGGWRGVVGGGCVGWGEGQGAEDMRLRMDCVGVQYAYFEVESPTPLLEQDCTYLKRDDSHGRPNECMVTPQSVMLGMMCRVKCWMYCWTYWTSDVSTALEEGNSWHAADIATAGTIFNF
jgi:hypothetical protein